MTLPEPLRERQAKAEIGHTDATPAVAWLLVLASLLILAGVPALEIAAGRSLAAAFGAARDEPPGIAAALRGEGALAANRALLAAMQRFEDELERESRLTHLLLPPAQALLLRLGAGNEKVHVGRAGWLDHRPDVDYAIAPGFLVPEVLARRARSGDAWHPPPHPDPLPPILALAAQLAARDIALVVMPTPVKPVVRPEPLSRRAAILAAPLQNPSFAEFRRRLEAEGVRVLDLAPELRAAARAGEEVYLERDTHWTPRGLERAARRLAEVLRPLLRPAPAPAGYRRVAVEVSGAGDIAAMLKLPAGLAFPPQRVRAQRVLHADGRAWRPHPGAEVLLLGDSFTNVYSEAALGWGTGAGLAETLSFHLDRPIDRIALDAGGAHASRERLAAQLRSGVDRLAGTRAVVYQFAVRELTSGDWRPAELPP